MRWFGRHDRASAPDATATGAPGTDDPARGAPGAVGAAASPVGLDAVLTAVRGVPGVRAAEVGPGTDGGQSLLVTPADDDLDPTAAADLATRVARALCEAFGLTVDPERARLLPDDVLPDDVLPDDVLPGGAPAPRSRVLPLHRVGVVTTPASVTVVVVSVGAHRVAVVGVAMVAPGRAERLTGSAPVDGDSRQGRRPRRARGRHAAGGTPAHLG